mmetsp:Transcript_20217/g.57618  ORF Transcript_20217/g.57618 Transcript_20217/m.57618 type:complete len:286 (+) Transcript_20217:489-1346(+)
MATSLAAAVAAAAAKAGKGGEATQALALRERAIARADDLSGVRVENAVLAAFKELGTKPDRARRAARVFNDIAGQYPTALGKAISKKEREDDPSVGDSDSPEAMRLVYGEIQFWTFALTLEKIRVKYGGLQEPGGTFVDIGAGTGKPVFAAMLLHEFDKVVGIEILEGLHEISLELQAIWNEIRGEVPVTPKTRKTKVELLRGDALKLNWADADLAFCNSTCFDQAMMALLAERADAMRPGAFFVTFTRRLPSKRWQVLEYERHSMSWGEATVFIHVRLGDETCE